MYSVSGGGYSGNQENRYVGFGNTVSPEKKEDDFINNAMSSIYSVRRGILDQWHSALHFCNIFLLFFFQGWSSFTVGASKFASIAKDNVSVFLEVLQSRSLQLIHDH